MSLNKMYSSRAAIDMNTSIMALEANFFVYCFESDVGENARMRSAYSLGEYKSRKF